MNRSAYGAQCETKMNAQGNYDQCVLRKNRCHYYALAVLFPLALQKDLECAVDLRGSIYSYDRASEKSVCCPPGQLYTFDSSANVESCRAEGTVFECSCESIFDPNDCPGADRKLVNQANGRTWKIFRDKDKQ